MLYLVAEIDNNGICKNISMVDDAEMGHFCNCGVGDCPYIVYPLGTLEAKDDTQFYEGVWKLQQLLRSDRGVLRVLRSIVDTVEELSRKNYKSVPGAKFK